jgi:hypothetical protein
MLDDRLNEEIRLVGLFLAIQHNERVLSLTQVNGGG